MSQNGPTYFKNLAVQQMLQDFKIVCLTILVQYPLELKSSQIKWSSEAVARRYSA